MHPEPPLLDRPALNPAGVDRLGDRRQRFLGDLRRALDQLLRDPGWATGVQLAGTLFFNLSTFGALTAGLSTHQENRVVWAPDVFGSACFLVASWLAWTASRDRVGAWNLCGSFAFGIAAAASYVVPKTGDVLALAPANLTTVLGALCFLAGSLLLLPPVRDRR